MAIINLFGKKRTSEKSRNKKTTTTRGGNNKTPSVSQTRKGSEHRPSMEEEQPIEHSSYRCENSLGASSVSSCGDSVGAKDVSVQSVGSTGSSKMSSSPRSNRKEDRPCILSRSRSSAIGLDEMMQERREVGQLIQNVVHIEFRSGKPIEEVYDGVHDGRVLGSGISGEVKLVKHKATGIQYACKALDLDLVNNPMQLRDEILIMSKLDHPNIVRLEEVYESHSAIYLVQELCLGRELFDRLEEQEDYHYSEAECARLVKQILCAVRYLHSKGIVHRDLKLENFLFSSDHENSELKLIDFGLSKYFQAGEVLHDAVGTPYTVAPEVIRGSYGERCDIWAIGVIAFLLLSGVPPFGGCGGPEPLMAVRRNILNGTYAFGPEDIWDHVGQTAKDFIRKLLVVDPNERPTAAQALQHEWIQEWVKKNSTGDRTLRPNVIKSLVNFKGYSDMRKLLLEVLSFTLVTDQLRELRLEFEKMDTEGRGEISLDALKRVLKRNTTLTSGIQFTEKEVTEIFNAMRVHKTEEGVHWHEFIAAGISECSIDDRNLRIAFERIDSDHKGLITKDDIIDLLGCDAPQSEQQLRDLWGSSTAKLLEGGIAYDDFLCIMKGDDQWKSGQPPLKSKLGRSKSSSNSLPEKPCPMKSTCSVVSLDEERDTPKESTDGSIQEPGNVLERQFSLLQVVLSMKLCTG